MPFYLYGLEDPRTDALRYIGYTGNPAYRHAQHMTPAKLRGRCHRVNWLTELKTLGLWPVMVILAQRDDRTAIQIAEREAIARFRTEGHDLVNGTPGGDGGPTMLGRKHSAISIAKTAAANRGRKKTLEQRRALSDACMGRNKGVPLSEEHRKKIGEAQRGRTIPPDHRAKVSKANKGLLAGMRWRVEHGTRVWFGQPSQPGAPRVCACGSAGPFYRSRATRDGLTAKCQACHRKRSSGARQLSLTP